VTGDSLPGIEHLLAFCGSWVLLIYGISTAYVRTVERFDHADWWNDRHRFLLEERSRRRL
jgi:hypothetical protein